MSDGPSPPPAGVGVRALLVGVLILFALVPLALSNTWGHHATRRFLLDAAARNAANVAALEAARTDQFVRDRGGHLRAMAGTIALLPRGAGGMSGFLTAGGASEPEGSAFWLLAPDGTPMATSIGAPPAPPGCGSPQAGVEFSPGKDEPTLVVSTRVGTDGRRLCSGTPFILHHTFVADSGQRVTGARISLLDLEGHLLCGSVDLPEHSVGEREDHDEHGGLRLLDGAPVRPEGRAWSRPARNDEGRRVLASLAPLQAIRGGVLAEVPVAEALAPLTHLARSAAGLSSLLVAILILAVWAVSSGLTRPLLRLSSAAVALAEGRLDSRVVPSGPRELRQVADRFNAMAEGLRDAQELLEQRIAERTRELEESRAFVELLFDSVDQELRVFGPDLRVLKTNRHARGPASSVGAPCSERCGEASPCDGCEVRRVFETGEATVTERTRSEGTVAEIVRAEAWPVGSADGSVRAVVEIARVVTGEKQVAAQLLHREKMAALGLITAGLAHEIGNPLSAILAELQRAHGEASTEALREILQTVEEQSQRMHRLLRELVDFSRRRRDVAALVSVNQVVLDVARLMGHDPRSRGVDVRIEAADPLPPVRAKEDHVIQVLLNLGLNALDAVGEVEHRVVTFQTTVEDGRVVVRVRDSGPGVPPAQRGRIFQPFWTSKGPQRGTGLGLFLSRGVVEDLGGQVDLEAGEPGACCFRVTLPVEREEAGG